MTDSPLATPTIALQCDHPPLANDVLARSPMRASATYSGVRGAAYHYARPHGVVSSAAPLLRWQNLRVATSIARA